MASPEITHLLSLPPSPQPGCPLFSLPSEIRHYIYKFALADYPDPNPDAQFPTSTYYSRPDYAAPRKSSTTLLRTCRQIFQECWFMPFVLREQIHYITAPDRMPPDYDYREIWTGPDDPLPDENWDRVKIWNRHLTDSLEAIVRQQGGKVEIESLRLYAQMYKLEEDKMSQFMSLMYLHPKKVTLTIRHQDWWYWEEDKPLYFKGEFLISLGRKMSPSVNEFVFELESLARKKDQVLQIAAQMRQKWWVTLSDGNILLADVTGRSDTGSSWTGCSFWEGARWVRDETAPKSIDYYVHTVTFRPAHVIERMGGEISTEAQARAGGELDDDLREWLRLDATAAVQLQGKAAIPVDSQGDLYEDGMYLRGPFHEYCFLDDEEEDYQDEESPRDADEGRKNHPELFGLMTAAEIETVCNHSTAAEYEAWWHQINPVTHGNSPSLTWWYEKRLAHRGY